MRARGSASAPASPASRSRTTPATRNAPLYALSEAVERLRAARAAINASGEKVLLTARSEAILRQAGGLTEALRRLAAYAEAGADVLYAPLVKTPEEVAEVVRVAGKLPVNVLVGWPGFTSRQLEDLGVKRISVGGALASRRLGRIHARGERHRGARPVRRVRRTCPPQEIEGAFADKC